MWAIGKHLNGRYVQLYGERDSDGVADTTRNNGLGTHVFVWLRWDGLLDGRLRCLSSVPLREQRELSSITEVFGYVFCDGLTEWFIRGLQLLTIDLDNPLRCNTVEASMDVTESGSLRSSYKECILE